MQQVQRQVFPKGRPADTAGFVDEPAASQSSVITLDQRLDALERQMADIVRQSEENGNRLRTLEDDLANAPTDQDQRIATIEQRLNDAAAAAGPPASAAEPVTGPPRPPAARPRPQPGATTLLPPATSETAVATDPGEDAYSAAFRQWEAGQYDD